MLQRIENLYLAILRLVVIAAAGALLIAVGLFGLNSFKGLVSEPEPIKQEPAVSVDDLRSQLTATPERSPDAGEDSASDATDNSTENDLRAASSTMSKFVEVQSNGDEGVDEAKVYAFLSERAETYSDRALDAAYAKNIKSAFAALMKDETAFKASDQSSPFEFLQASLLAFNKSFDREVKNVDDQNELAQANYIETKSEGMQSLYIAAAAFAAFLTVVFLSIIIRIERNLRNLEVLSVKEGGDQH